VKERSGQVGTEPVTELVCEARTVLPPEGRHWPYYEGTPADRAGEYGEIVAIPYYAWANRGPMPMRVWAPELS
jgi:DUF1680 family protein